jgi:FKBP-type peptidyl-prolyl cis-trans isomerase (trigger factor)
LKIETEDLQDRQVQLTVEVPADASARPCARLARRLGSTTRIPGFGRAKCPTRSCLGASEKAVFEEALDALGQEVYRQALEDPS